MSDAHERRRENNVPFAVQMSSALLPLALGECASGCTKSTNDAAPKVCTFGHLHFSALRSSWSKRRHLRQLAGRRRVAKQPVDQRHADRIDPQGADRWDEISGANELADPRCGDGDAAGNRRRNGNEDKRVFVHGSLTRAARVNNIGLTRHKISSAGRGRALLRIKQVELMEGWIVGRLAVGLCARWDACINVGERLEGAAVV